MRFSDEKRTMARGERSEAVLALTMRAPRGSLCVREGSPRMDRHATGHRRCGRQRARALPAPWLLAVARKEKAVSGRASLHCSNIGPTAQ